MESKAKMRGNGIRKDVGMVCYADGCLILQQKPTWASVFFGAIGNALVSYKEVMRIPVAEIRRITLENRGSKAIYTVTRNDGNSWDLTFSDASEVMCDVLNQIMAEVA